MVNKVRKPLRDLYRNPDRYIMDPLMTHKMACKNKKYDCCSKGEQCIGQEMLCQLHVWATGVQDFSYGRIGVRLGPKETNKLKPTPPRAMHGKPTLYDFIGYMNDSIKNNGGPLNVFCSVHKPDQTKKQFDDRMKD